MAKRGAKADAIRAYIEQNPRAKAREVIDALAKQRIKVSQNQVYGLLNKTDGQAPAPKAPETNGQPPVAEQPLLTAKAFVVSAGGVEKARAMIDTLVSLQLT